MFSHRKKPVHQGNELEQRKLEQKKEVVRKQLPYQPSGDAMCNNSQLHQPGRT
jgi:hypothetical protein